MYSTKVPPALQARGEAFRTALIALCREHGFRIEHYRVKYDEYDSDEGYEIVPIKVGESLYDLESAMVKKR